MALLSGQSNFNAVRGVLSLFSNTNKAKSKEWEDDVAGVDEQTPEFESSMTDEEIRILTAQWESKDDVYTKDIKKQAQDNVDYWIGKQSKTMDVIANNRPTVDNLIFEALETFLPIATRGNPQANVYGNGTPEGDKVAKTVEKALEYQAGRQFLRMKLKGVTRNWALYMIGAIKINWDAVRNDIDTEVILPSNLIFDPNAKIDVQGFYKGEYLGERMKKTAGQLVKLFPNKKEYIKALVDGEMGTIVKYICWTTRQDVFFTCQGEPLGKFKNPHWNYNGTNTIIDPETGAENEEETKGINHFAQPEFNYLFLTVFNTGKRPHDQTSLINQNIPLQDMINKRYRQMERNVDAQNNGIVLSGKHFTKEQAAEAATQLSNGNPLWVPEGAIGDSYVRDQAPQLSGDIYKQLSDARQELRNVFGTAGSSAQGIAKEDTARGKIMINQLDSSRIGGGVTEYIEQLANGLFNWYVQMMYVWYTEDHEFAVFGPKAQELMKLKNLDLNLKLHVVVKEGSLIPKDPLTKRNEALDLWNAGAMDPITLFTALDYPNPYESAKQAVLWDMIKGGKIDPTVMFPDIMGQQAVGMPVGAGPGENTTPAVNATEDNANMEPNTVGNVPQVSSQQIMQSVPVN